LRCKNHINTFIFGGTFIFQIFFLRYFVLSFRTFKYMHLIVYPPKAGRLQTKTSIYYASLPSQRHHLFSENVRKNSIFSGE
jgi:hypothetical protein